MKTFVRQSAIAASLILAITANAVQSQARNQKPVYDKALQPAIGVTVSNATGALYTIRDHKNKIVQSGLVRQGQQCYIPTAKLPKGSYRFMIGEQVFQEFAIR